MERQEAALNRFLVEAFDEILKTEEACLAPMAEGLTLREIHLIEAVCRAVDGGLDNRSTAIAAAQRVTAGTLTTAVTALERKGCLERRRSQRDKRVVRIYPTERARKVQKIHADFHQELVDAVLRDLSQEEALAFTRGLESVARFFREKYRERWDGERGCQHGENRDCN